MIKNFSHYIHTNQDKIDDMIFIEEFSNNFENEFEYRLNLKINKPHFRTNFDYGANNFYSGDIIIYNKKYYNKKIKFHFLIMIETEIDPHNNNGRIFKICFQFDKSCRIENFNYSSNNIDDVIRNFDNYIQNELHIYNLTDEELKIKKMQKRIKKYNI